MPYYIETKGMATRRTKPVTKGSKKASPRSNSKVSKDKPTIPVVPAPWDEFIGMFENEPAARDVEKLIAANREKWVRVL